VLSALNLLQALVQCDYHTDALRVSVLREGPESSTHANVELQLPFTLLGYYVAIHSERETQSHQDQC
jgi:hypothetical protein